MERSRSLRQELKPRQGSAPALSNTGAGKRVESRLLDRLQMRRVSVTPDHSFWAATSADDKACCTLVTVVPLSGNNDLSPEAEAAFQGLTRTKFHSRRILVIFKGDRHITDPTVDDRYPAVVKVRYLLRHAGELIICPHKLDDDTANWIIKYAERHLCDPFPVDRAVISRLQRLIGRSVTWDPTDRLLDVSDATMRADSLGGLSRSVLRLAASIIRTLHPKVLIAKGSGLSDCSFNQSGSLDAIAVDISSNNVSLSVATRLFPLAEHLDLGANELLEISLSEAESVPQHLYLYKNRLSHVGLEQGGPGSLRTLSLYRNRLQSLDTANQSQLRYVNLGANPIRVVPASLQGADHLRSLGLARTHVTSLPDWIVESRTLKSLDISYIEDAIPVSQLAKLRTQGVKLITRPLSPSYEEL